MLVLTRKITQRIMIGNDITITLVRIGVDNVQIGVEAPENMPIYREEIASRIKNEGSLADRDKQRTEEN